MKDIKLVLREVKGHLEYVIYDIGKILEKGLNEKFLEEKDYIILLDAFIFRFIELQSSVSEKLFPLVYEYLTGKEYTEATFIDILNTLEKYKVIPSAEEWKEIRKLRNEFVHIYPWETGLKLKAVELAIEKVKTIKEVIRKVEELINA
ncbi:hypothetical protein [Aquifex sp.]